MIVPGDTTSSFGSDKVSGIAVYVKDHVTGVEAYIGVGVCVDIVHETLRFFHGFLSGLCLFGGDFVQSRKNSVVECTAVI